MELIFCDLKIFYKRNVLLQGSSTQYVRTKIAKIRSPYPLVHNHTHLTPPPPLTFMRTYFLYIHPLPHPPPNKFLFKFKFSSLTISRLEIYIKKISMVSIHSLRSVYTFLYTIINGNVITTFVQQKKSFEILWSKKIFAYVCNLVFYLTIKKCIELY